MREQHVYTPISWKPPRAMEERFREYAARNGVSLSDLITRTMSQPLGMPEYQDYTSKRGRPDAENIQAKEG